MSIRTPVLIVLIAAAWYFFRSYLTPRPPKQVHGFCKPQFQAVMEEFRANMESGEEEGGAFAAYHQGELVCELWGGWADHDLQYPWQQHTLSTLYSATKPASAICVIMLAGRGLLDITSPVARYWPEFAQNGKENITVRMLMAHQAGLAAIDEDYSYKDVVNDPEKISRIFAAQKPHWQPGTQSGYHIMNYGLYLNEIVKRVDPQHRSIQQFFIQEIAQPLGIDLHLGLPLTEQYRLARPTPLNPIGPLLSLNALTHPDVLRFFYRLFRNQDSVLTRAINNPVDGQKEGAYFHSWPEYQAISDGSTHGYGTAEGLARLYGILANGNQILTPEGWDLLRQPVWTGQDRLLGFTLTWGHGVGMKQIKKDMWIVGMSGHGGQMGFSCPEKKLGWAYITNHLTLISEDKLPRYERLRDALMKAVP